MTILAVCRTQEDGRIVYLSHNGELPAQARSRDKVVVVEDAREVDELMRQIDAQLQAGKCLEIP